MPFMELNDDRSEKVIYDYADYPIYIRRAVLSLYPNYAALAHWHDDIELMYILSGTMQYNVNGEIVTLSAGEGLFINSRQMHFGFSAEKEECDFICVRLHPILLCANSAFESDYILPVLNSPAAGFIFLQRNARWQNEILDIILSLYEKKDAETAPLQVQSLFWRLWSLIFEHIPSAAVNRQKNTDFSALKNMLAFIQQNYRQKISLAEIAKAGVMGESKCCKLFSKYIGQTPNTYLTNYRLQKSIELLQSTDMTVTEIALASGFGGSSYFAEVFKRKYETSPTKYRSINGL